MTYVTDFSQAGYKILLSYAVLNELRKKSVKMYFCQEITGYFMMESYIGW